MLRKYDCEVADYISSFCAAGGIVNRSITIAATKIILSHRNPSLLKEHGSSLTLLDTRVPRQPEKCHLNFAKDQK